MRVLLTALIGALALPLVASGSAGASEGLPTDRVASQSGQAAGQVQRADVTVIGQPGSDAGMTYSLERQQFLVHPGISGDGKPLTYGVAPRDGENLAAADVDDGVGSKGENQ